MKKPTWNQNRRLHGRIAAFKAGLLPVAFTLGYHTFNASTGSTVEPYK